jgi:hypothetical protein
LNDEGTTFCKGHGGLFKGFLGNFCEDSLFERNKQAFCEPSQSSKFMTVLLETMNIFVNLFGRMGKFSVKDRKSNLR